MSIAAGRLRHRVRLESPVESQDPQTGAPIMSWSDQGDFWAAVEPVSVKDFIAADQRQVNVTTRIVLRRVAALNESWRVVHGSTVYQIVGVLPDAASGLEYVTLACNQGANPAGA